MLMLCRYGKDTIVTLKRVGEPFGKNNPIETVKGSSCAFDVEDDMYRL